MTNVRSVKTIAAALLLCAATTLQGCAQLDHAVEAVRNPHRDYHGGAELIDQIPNNEGSARRVCCGHLKSCLPHQSPRC
jgi:hypothetical protein